MKKIHFSNVLLILWISLSSAAPAAVPVPILPDYFSPAFEANGAQLEFMDHTVNEGTDRHLFYTPDKSLGLIIETTKCDRARADALFSGLMRNMNQDLGLQGGEFIEIHKNDFHARLFSDGVEKAVFTFRLPDSVQTWTYFVKPGEKNNEAPRFKMIQNFINREIWEITSKKDYTSPAGWASEIYDYASGLLRDGKKNEALPVLERLLIASPFNYNAHMDYAEITPDSEDSRNSANIVLKNSEDTALTERAAKVLGIKHPAFESYPLLERGEKGLQLILIPMPPCDMPLVEEASRIYNEITGIPVKIRRLECGWTWKAPDRIPYQKYIQKMLSGSGEKKINFGGWDLERYVSEILKSAEPQGALARYFSREFVSRIRREKGQYHIDSYVFLLLDILNRYASDDLRTMYVGVTENDIYSGDDNNFTFNLHYFFPASRASIFSYHMMKAENLEEEYQSRKRLTERMAKELVPASLKSLGIPRSTDPSCPYSLAGSVPRIDQKTLVLSDPVKKKLEELRHTLLAPEKKE